MHRFESFTCASFTSLPTEVILMDANYTVDEILGEDTFCINQLQEDVPIDYTFCFPLGSKVHAVLKLGKK